MKLSRQDIADFLNLFVFGMGARVFGFLTIFLLARQLSIDHFAWWQLSKTAAGYVLIVMEAGFFLHVTLLIQREGYSIRSVRSQIYGHRAKLGLIAIPFFYLYLTFTNVPMWYAALFLPFFLLSVADYDSLAVGAGKSVVTGHARFCKNALTTAVIALGFFHSFSALPILAATVGVGVAAIYLHRAVGLADSFDRGRAYTASLWRSLCESKHFFSMQLTQTLMQSADLIIAGVFLSNSDVAHYSVALLIAEFALYPGYMVQRVIQAKYVKSPNARFAAYISAGGVVIISIACLGHYFLLQSLYELLFPRFDPSLLHGLVNVLLLYVAIRIPNTFMQLHLNATGLGRYVSIVTLLGMLTNVGLNFALIPRLGLSVIPWVTVAAEAVILLSTVYSLKRGEREPAKI